jgi:hypothetical protein
MGTRRVAIQTLLENALSTAYLISFQGLELINPPRPRGRTCDVGVFGIDEVTLNNSP